ncbi:MAG: hypothetical protein K2M31_09420 [Muribaculaceae bacterium]|nr:hypothetical protein [Muribaculaceae bacterium]
MNPLFVIGAGPGVVIAFAVVAIILLWKKKPGCVILIALILIIAIIASQCDGDRQSTGWSGYDADDESSVPMSDAELDALLSDFDRMMDSVASLPAYKRAGRTLDSLGYEIQPTLTFTELELAPREADESIQRIVHGYVQDSDSIAYQFSMIFLGDPPVYQSVKIININSGQVVFADHK